MLLIRQSHAQSAASNAHNLILPETNLKNKDFASLNQTFKLLVWSPKFANAYIIVT